MCSRGPSGPPWMFSTAVRISPGCAPRSYCDRDLHHCRAAHPTASGPPLHAAIARAQRTGQRRSAEVSGRPPLSAPESARRPVRARRSRRARMRTSPLATKLERSRRCAPIVTSMSVIPTARYVGCDSSSNASPAESHRSVTLLSASRTKIQVGCWTRTEPKAGRCMRRRIVDHCCGCGGRHARASSVPPVAAQRHPAVQARARARRRMVLRLKWSVRPCVDRPRSRYPLPATAPKSSAQPAPPAPCGVPWPFSLRGDRFSVTARRRAGNCRRQRHDDGRIETGELRVLRQRLHVEGRIVEGGDIDLLEGFHLANREQQPIADVRDAEGPRLRIRASSAPISAHKRASSGDSPVGGAVRPENICIRIGLTGECAAYNR